jgi:deglycase
MHPARVGKASGAQPGQAGREVSAGQVGEGGENPPVVVVGGLQVQLEEDGGGVRGHGAFGGGRVGMVGFMVFAQRKVLILAADDFEDMELLYPLYRLLEENVQVIVAGLDDHPVRGKKGHGPVPVDTTVGQVAEGDFDALVIPGGYAPDKLRRSEAVLDLVRAFDDAKKPIAFICHAGWVPISARILKGRRATSVGAIRDDMVNAGTDWVDEATVVDGHLISARTPADLGPWMKALLKALAVG